jgi:hypothetical protein
VAELTASSRDDGADRNGGSFAVGPVDNVQRLEESGRDDVEAEHDRSIRRTMGR